MTIRKKKNHNLEHIKSVNALKRAGLVGLLITGDGKNAIASWLGQYEKAMADVYKIFVQNPMLSNIARAVANTTIRTEVTEKRQLAPDLEEKINTLMADYEGDKMAEAVYNLILDATFGEKIDSVVSIEETEPQNIENETV